MKLERVKICWGEPKRADTYVCEVYGMMVRPSSVPHDQGLHGLSVHDQNACVCCTVGAA